MRVAFRVDASNVIGNGHVLRCLTLADELYQHSDKIEFICRRLPGHILSYVEERGYQVNLLPERPETSFVRRARNDGGDCRTFSIVAELDCLETIGVLKTLGTVDVLVVDQYVLSCAWEAEISKYVGILIAIDDEPVRKHWVRGLVVPGMCLEPEACEKSLPAGADLLAGPEYVLLRPRFRNLRDFAIAERKRRTRSETIFVAFGGSNQWELYTAVIKALDMSKFSGEWKIQVVLGGTNRRDSRFLAAIAATSNQVEVTSFSDDVAKLAAQADIGIGAAGTMAWERCCLGLPSIALVLADNQRAIAGKLSALNVALEGGSAQEVIRKPEKLSRVVDSLREDGELRRRVSFAGMRLIDGLGVDRVVDWLLTCVHEG